MQTLHCITHKLSDAKFAKVRAKDQLTCLHLRYRHCVHAVKWRRVSRIPCITTTEASASAPKRGVVGPERFQESALPGTYFWSGDQHGKKIEIFFDTGTDDQLSIHVPAGSNLLRAAELAGAIKLNRDFCFEGSCELCQLEVEGGAQELGPKAQPGNQELVRGCITAVPCRQKGDVHVKVLSEESVWGEGVL